MGGALVPSRLPPGSLAPFSELALVVAASTALCPEGTFLLPHIMEPGTR